MKPLKRSYRYDAFQTNFHQKSSEDLRYIDFINYMIRLEIGLKLRHGGVIKVCVTEDKTAVVVVASYHSKSRNPVRFKALVHSVSLSRGTRS